MRQPNRLRSALRGGAAPLIVLFLYASYASWFIYRLSFSLFGERFFVLFDDAMISMRYARDLAMGYGPVWNAGAERVEGFTNPLWMAYMAAFHLLPIPASKMSLPIQITGLVCVGVTSVAAYLLAARISPKSPVVPTCAMVLTAFYLPLNIWSLSGMEVGAVTALTTLALLWTVRGIEGGRFRAAVYVLLGVSVLIRMDAVVTTVAVLTIAMALDPVHRWRHCAVGAGVLVATLAGLTLARVAYYGNPLPNTYYLKLLGYPRVPVPDGGGAGRRHAV